VFVKPNARRGAVVGPRPDPQYADKVELEVAVDAPAQEGAANEALLRLLGRFFQLSKSSLTLERGATSRHKVVRLRGVTLQHVLTSLRSLEE